MIDIGDSVNTMMGIGNTMFGIKEYNTNLAKRDVELMSSASKSMSLDSSFAAQCRTLMSRVIGNRIGTSISLTGLERTAYYDSSKLPKALTDNFTVMSMAKLGSNIGYLKPGDYWSYVEDNKAGHFARLLYGLDSKGNVVSDFTKAVKIGMFQSFGQLGQRVDKPEITLDSKGNETSSYYYHKPTGEWFKLNSAGATTIDILKNTDNLQISDTGELSAYNIYTERDISYVMDNFVFAKGKYTNNQRMVTAYHDKHAGFTDDYYDTFAEESYKLRQQQVNNRENKYPNVYTGSAALGLYNSIGDTSSIKKTSIHDFIKAKTSSPINDYVKLISKGVSDVRKDISLTIEHKNKEQKYFWGGSW